MNRAALVLVATPIGNLGDISPRAVEAPARCHPDLLRGHPPQRQLLTTTWASAGCVAICNEHTEADDGSGR